MQNAFHISEREEMQVLSPSWALMRLLCVPKQEKEAVVLHFTLVTLH